MEINKLLKIIDKYDAISFDMFDTLIIRAVNKPSQIFDIVEARYNSKNEEKIVEFKNNRMMCEKKVIDHIANLDDIYRNLTDFYTKEQCEKLKMIEIDVENKYCIPNDSIKKVYEYCKKQKKKMYVVSDMYLSSQILSNILKKCGYEFDTIIVSNEKNCTKKSSCLFKYIPNYGNDRILHIGDSFKADYIGARLAKIQSFRIQKNHFEEENDNIAAIKNLVGENDYFYELGYKTLGPVLLNYVSWLKERFEESGIKKIYFFAREGKIFKTVFDEMFINEEFETKYLYISRRAITMSNYNNRKFDSLREILEYFTIKKTSTLADTIDYLNIELDYDDFESKKNIYEYCNDERLLYIFKEKLKAESKNVNRITYEYFKQEGLTGNFAIVDIGWNGTMQKCLIEFLRSNNIEFSLKGYYFSLFKKLENGYSYVNCEKKLGQSIKDNPILIENLFQCLDGSTVGYKYENSKKICPIKKEMEFNESTMNAISEIDNGIICFMKNWLKYGFIIDSNKCESRNLYNLRKFIDNPNLWDIRNFQSFCYSDIKNNDMLISTEKNIKKGLFNSGWKYGYLKKILKVNINYKFIVKILKKIGGK